MFKLWIWTTGVLVFQCLVFSIIYAATGEFEATVGTTTIITLSASIAPLIALRFVRDLADPFIIFCAFLVAGSFTAPFVELSRGVFFFIAPISFLLGAGIAFIVTAFIKKILGAKEPFWLLYLTALPAGLGTILGGLGLITPYFGRIRSVEPI